MRKNNQQVQKRLKKAVVPCDKLSIHMWGYSPEEYAEILTDGDSCGCIEGRDRQGKTIRTPYWLKLCEGYVDLSPLTPFHRELLFVAISAYEQGVRIITFGTTHRTLTGDNRALRSKEIYDALKAGFDKLIFTRFATDLTPLLNAYPKYRKRHVGSTELVSPLLPGKYIETVINGKKVMAIELLGESPLMTVAKLKRQLISYNIESLFIPNLHDTELCTVIKNWLLRRIALIERGLSSSILYKTLYEECGIADADKWKKQDARKIVEVVLNHFKSEGVISDFEIIQDGGSYRAVLISL